MVRRKRNRSCATSAQPTILARRREKTRLLPGPFGRSARTPRVASRRTIVPLSSQTLGGGRREGGVAFEVVARYFPGSSYEGHAGDESTEDANGAGDLEGRSRAKAEQ
jgi:hypothetical protein